MATAACNDRAAIERPTQSAESPHFVYRYGSDDATVTPETTANLEAHYAAFHRFFGLQDGDGPIAYTKYRNRQSLREFSPCSAAAQACFFRDGGVFTVEALSRHELVHAYMAKAGDSHRLLEEGLAVALSCDDGGVEPVTYAFEEAFSSRHWASAPRHTWKRLYRAGAKFAAHVVRSFGGPAFLELHRALGPGTETAEAAEVVQGVLGRPLAEVWSEALAELDPFAACITLD